MGKKDFKVLSKMSRCHLDKLWFILLAAGQQLGLRKQEVEGSHLTQSTCAFTSATQTSCHTSESLLNATTSEIPHNHGLAEYWLN